MCMLKSSHCLGKQSIVRESHAPVGARLYWLSECANSAAHSVGPSLDVLLPCAEPCFDVWRKPTFYRLWAQRWMKSRKTIKDWCILQLLKVQEEPHQMLHLLPLQEETPNCQGSHRQHRSSAESVVRHWRTTPTTKLMVDVLNAQRILRSPMNQAKE